MNCSKPKNREKGISLIIATVAMVGIIPMVGLFVDLGILYASKARLQAAVDGAALAAARSLNLGQSTTAQANNAKQTAVNWFYANFPNGNWSTSGTVMTSANVTVVDDANNAHQRDVTVTATTNVPTYFMRFLNFNSNTLNVTGQAARRDLVAMLVMDRSGSMCSINGVLQGQPCGEGDGTACDSMITAAKNFTGQFAAGRDQIGLMSFSDGQYKDLAPTINFQTQLGYTNSTGSGTGIIDNITCAGGTGTAGAMSRAYNELYKMMLPGALNVLVLETDGLPNTITYNFNTNNTHAGMGLQSTSGCQDQNGHAYSGARPAYWNSAAAMKQWTAGLTMGPNGFMSDIPAGPIGAVYTNDPNQGAGISLLTNPWQTSSSNGTSDTLQIYTSGGSATAQGCQWNPYNHDFAFLPSTDAFGNSVNPANAYQSVTMTSGHVAFTGTLNTDWTNAHAAAENATENSAYRIRSNATLPAYVFAIGLGGNAGNPPDPILLQRMANDPNGDVFNSPATYPACSTEPTCVTYSSQPQGVFVYSPNASSLGSAFLRISDEVLRLSH